MLRHVNVFESPFSFQHMLTASNPAVKKQTYAEIDQAGSLLYLLSMEKTLKIVNVKGQSLLVYIP